MGLKSEDIGWNLSFEMICKNYRKPSWQFYKDKKRLKKWMKDAAEGKEIPPAQEFNKRARRVANKLEVVIQPKKEKTPKPVIDTPKKIRTKIKNTIKDLGFYDNPVKMLSDIEQYNKKVIEDNEKIEVEQNEYQQFLATQTIEQLILAKKHGWKMAKILTEPECNFHYE